jgi:hypothetical protein
MAQWQILCASRIYHNCVKVFLSNIFKHVPSKKVIICQHITQGAQQDSVKYLSLQQKYCTRWQWSFYKPTTICPSQRTKQSQCTITPKRRTSQTRRTRNKTTGIYQTSGTDQNRISSNTIWTTICTECFR